MLRGLWGGPWLMDVKGLGRIEAGNDLGLFTLALIVGPLLVGIFDRKFGHRRAMLASAHLVAAAALILTAAGAPHYFVSNLFGVAVMPPLYDVSLFVLFGLAISAQPLLFGMTRQLVEPQNAGKALSAINLAFFLGAALMQSVTGVVAAALRPARGADLHGAGTDRRGDGVFGVYLAGQAPTHELSGGDCHPARGIGIFAVSRQLAQQFLCLEAQRHCFALGCDLDAASQRTNDRWSCRSRC